MSKKLFEQLARLLEYSGQSIREKQLTNDGATAVVDMDGEQIRIYVAPVVNYKKKDVTYCEPEMNY